jgi:hypothetical protein
MTNGVCRSFWRVKLEVLWLLSARLWIEVLESFLCLMVLYGSSAVYRMSMWVLLCSYVAEVCFLSITWIYGPKARTSIVILTSDEFIN